MEEVKQAGLFGGYKLIVKKVKKPKELPAKNVLKEKIKRLYTLYEELYELQEIEILETREIIIKGNILIYPQDRQAEPKELINLTIYDIDLRIEKMKEFLNVRN